MRKASGELLTIGAFARASALSAKALRLYDELGLLRPCTVDEASGYRFYAPEQLERARLAAWLRRLGMPLARIKVVCELDAPAAAEDRKEEPMTPLAIRYAALSDRGLVRASNQDAAYAGAHLLAVADGFGPDLAGQRASARAGPCGSWPRARARRGRR
ncbi:MerR family transcriptional regulator [Amycolatopsis cynarae]|uniref:MerR family transcriptional regulator n=1 Tax=Amycolatopsis cynarae TaxID=2995223 RepID=A0ABY7B2C5_9PSEU|nr:MerR family transcriptional regulator [Amycolatopsis sp. HUAS 11-8]WAL65589.1 MerR family transcriptional regulator [Amycolatopsis sp. HUAS 11-8]